MHDIISRKPGLKASKWRCDHQVFTTERGMETNIFLDELNILRFGAQQECLVYLQQVGSSVFFHVKTSVTQNQIAYGGFCGTSLVYGFLTILIVSVRYSC